MINPKSFDKICGVKKAPFDQLESLLTFTIGGICCCVNLMDVAAIIDTEELNQNQSIESEDPHIVLTSIKIPLVDIYQLYGISTPPIDKNTRLIVTEVDNHLLAFLVEKVNSVFYVDKEMRDKTKFIECKNLLHLNGMINYEDKLFFLLDIKNFIKNQLVKEVVIPEVSQT